MVLKFGKGGGVNVILGLFFLCLFSFVDSAEALHKGAGNLVCGNCHTMHNSQGNSGLGGASGGSLVLLRGNVNSRGEIHNLCLQCHASNGSQEDVLHAPQNVEAPKVYSDADWTQYDSFSLIGAGGNFWRELGSGTDYVTDTPLVLGYGHSMGATNVTPPGGDMELPTFSCTDCHDPHGTSDPTNENINIFRNLRVNAVNAGDNSGVKIPNEPARPWLQANSYVGGVNGSYFGSSTEQDRRTHQIWPIYTTRDGVLTGNPITDSANSNSYPTGWDGNGGATISKWCSQCHDNWHEDLTPNNQAHVATPGGQYRYDLDSRRHMVNSAMPRASAPGCAQDCHVSLLDRSNYDATVISTGRGLPVTANQYFSGNSFYLPECGAAGVACTDYMDDLLDNRMNKVFCLSCHFAHGGPYLDNLRWEYLDSVDTGSQTGNGVPVDIGCQLCHNR